MNVTNTGKIAGAEVPQLVGGSACFGSQQYVTYPKSEVEQPPKHLRGYEKVYLLPGQQKSVIFPLVSEVDRGHDR